MARPKGVSSIRDKAYNRNQLDLCRAKIETSKLISLLHANALEGKELDSVRQKSIEILLRKALPDLTATEMEITENKPFAVVPQEIQDVSEWERKVAETTVLGPDAKVKH
jgi:hypothetical protein